MFCHKNRLYFNLFFIVKILYDDKMYSNKFSRFNELHQEQKLVQK